MSDEAQTESTPSFTDLTDQRAEIERQIARLFLPKIAEAREVLASPAAVEVMEKIRNIIKSIPEGAVAAHLGYVVTVLTSVPVALSEEYAKNNVIANPTPPIVPTIIPAAQ